MKKVQTLKLEEGGKVTSLKCLKFLNQVKKVNKHFKHVSYNTVLWFVYKTIIKIIFLLLGLLKNHTFLTVELQDYKNLI